MSEPGKESTFASSESIGTPAQWCAQSMVNKPVWGCVELVRKVCLYAGPDATYALARTCKSLYWLLHDEIWQIFTADCSSTGYYEGYIAVYRQRLINESVEFLFNKLRVPHINALAVSSLVNYVPYARAWFDNEVQRPRDLCTWFWAHWLLTASNRIQGLRTIFKINPFLGIEEEQKPDTLQLLVAMYMVRFGTYPLHVRELNKHERKQGDIKQLVALAQVTADQAKCDILASRVMVRTALLARFTGGLICNYETPCVEVDKKYRVDMNTLEIKEITSSDQIYRPISSEDLVSYGLQIPCDDLFMSLQALDNQNPLLKCRELFRCLASSIILNVRSQLHYDEWTSTRMPGLIGCITVVDYCKVVILEVEEDSLLVLLGDQITRVPYDRTVNVVQAVPTAWIMGMELPVIDVDWQILGQYFYTYDKTMCRFLVPFDGLD